VSTLHRLPASSLRLASAISSGQRRAHGAGSVAVNSPPYRPAEHGDDHHHAGSSFISRVPQGIS